jgi:hypothetical protein
MAEWPVTALVRPAATLLRAWPPEGILAMAEWPVTALVRPAATLLRAWPPEGILARADGPAPATTAPARTTAPTALVKLNVNILQLL